MKIPLETTITEKSEFFDPDAFEFKVLGFFEEVLDVETNRQYGIRLIEKPDRPLGSPGTIERTFTENFDVLRSFKTLTIKASSKRPRKCRLTLQAICGMRKGVAA